MTDDNGKARVLWFTPKAYGKMYSSIMTIIENAARIYPNKFTIEIMPADQHAKLQEQLKTAHQNYDILKENCIKTHDKQSAEIKVLRGLLKGLLNQCQSRDAAEAGIYKQALAESGKGES